MNLRKKHAETLLLALITNLNPKINSLTEDQKRIINQGGTITFSDLGGVKGASLTLTIGGIFVLLTDSRIYNAIAIKTNKPTAENVYKILYRAVTMNTETDSSSPITDNSDDTISSTNSEGTSPAATSHISLKNSSSTNLNNGFSFFSPTALLTAESSSHMSSTSSSTSISPTLDPLKSVSAPNLDKTSSFFSPETRSQSTPKLMQREPSNLQEMCLKLSHSDIFLTIKDDNIRLPILILASCNDLTIAINLYKSKLIDKMDDTDKRYLQAFLQLNKDEKAQKLCKKIKPQIPIALNNKSASNKADEYASGYFTAKIKNNAQFAFTVLTAPLFYSILKLFSEQLCANLANIIASEKIHGDEILKLVCQSDRWDNICQIKPRLIIINMLLKLIQSHKYIPGDLLNENLLCLFLKEEFVELKEIIQRLSLGDALAQSFFDQLTTNSAFAEKLSKSPCIIDLIKSLKDILVQPICEHIKSSSAFAKRLSGVLYLLNSDPPLFDSEIFIKSMLVHAEHREIIAAVFSKLGYRKTTVRIMKVQPLPQPLPQDYSDCIIKLKEWFTYKVLTADACTQRAFCAGSELLLEHQKKKAISCDHFFLIQHRVIIDFEKRAAEKRTKYKNDFVAEHKKLTELFENTFLPNIEEHLDELIEIHNAYNLAMFALLSSSDPKACNPESYELDRLPKQVRDYFTENEKQEYHKILIKMKSIYAKQLAFKKKYEINKQNIQVSQYETSSYIAKVVLDMKVRKECAKKVTNLDEFSRQIRDSLHNVIGKLKDNIPNLIKDYPFDAKEELYVHSQLLEPIYKALIMTTHVDTAIHISDKKQLESLLLKDIELQAKNPLSQSPETPALKP